MSRRAGRSRAQPEAAAPAAAAAAAAADDDVVMVAAPLALGGGMRAVARRREAEAAPVEVELRQNMEDMASPSGMTNSHRLLVQTFMSRRYMTEADTRKALLDVLRAYNHPDTLDGGNGGRWWDDAKATESVLNKVLSTINNNLRFMQLEIKKVMSESPAGTVYYGLITTKSDAFSQLATEFTLEEIALFKKIIDAIVASPEDRALMPRGELPLLEAQNLGVELAKPLTGRAANAAVDKLSAGGWLERTGQGEDAMVAAGIRTLLELRPWMEEFYEGQIPPCILCADPVLKGQSCPNIRCTVRAHTHCLTTWFRGRRERRCPTCTQEWHQD